MTVTQIVASAPAAGIDSPGARTSVQPIDPLESSVLTLKGDLWAINIEPNDCDFHLEVSEVGGSVDSDRVIVEIPQTAPFVTARNALLNKLHAAGGTLHARTKLTQPIRVQVLGFAFYDAWHFSCQQPSTWEPSRFASSGFYLGDSSSWGDYFPDQLANSFRHDANVSGDGLGSPCCTTLNRRR